MADSWRCHPDCSAPADPGLPLVSALLTVARFLTCLMMWEILRALFDASLSSGIVIPDASIVMWGLGGKRAARFQVRCAVVSSHGCVRAVGAPGRRYVPPAEHVVWEK